MGGGQNVMVKAHPVQHSFNGGEVSPFLDARSDTETYYNSCRTLRNAIVRPQGAATRRKGTVYIDSTKNGGLKARSIPFIFSEIES